MTTTQSFGKNLKARASKCVEKVLSFLDNPVGYLEVELILVTPIKQICVIVVYQGRIDHKEVEFARAVVAELHSKGIRTIEVDESVRPSANLRKTAGFNRRNVSGWSQSNTILKCINENPLDLEKIRNEYIFWKLSNNYLNYVKIFS